MAIELNKLESIPIELKVRLILIVNVNVHVYFCLYLSFLLFSKEILEDENIVKVGSSTFNQVKYLLRNYGTFVTSVFDIRFLIDALKYPKIQLERLCEVFLNVEFDADTNAAYVDVELFKLFAEQVQPKKPNEDEKIHVQHIIQKYTYHHLDLKYIGDMCMAKALTVIVNDLDTYSSLMPILNLYVHIQTVDFDFIEQKANEIFILF